MSSKTDKNLAYAFAAESKAAVRNETFAKKASNEKLPGIALLFRAMAESESVHARKYLLLMRGKVGSTEENLQYALEYETKAKDEEYPKLIKDAVEGGAKGVEKAFIQSQEAENRHAELYKIAIQEMTSVNTDKYFVCQICGYIHENHAPENCPVCNAVKTRFKEISA